MSQRVNKKFVYLWIMKEFGQWMETLTYKKKKKN